MFSSLVAVLSFVFGAVGECGLADGLQTLLMVCLCSRTIQSNCCLRCGSMPSGLFEHHWCARYVMNLMHI